MSRSTWAIIVVAILVAMGIWGTPRPAGAASSGTGNVKLSDIPVGKVIQVGSVKFVKVGSDQYVAVNLCPEGSTYQVEYKGCVANQTTWKMAGAYTFTALENGYYILEVWGAQGGNTVDTYQGGYGGYSQGMVEWSKNQKFFVVVGGKGSDSVAKQDVAGGYNGGGSSDLCEQHTNDYAAGGGGATHISSYNCGELKNCVSYKGYILLVAGGGGGSYWGQYTGRPTARGSGGIGGGETGGYGYTDQHVRGLPGTQTAGGQSGCTSRDSGTECTKRYGSFGLGGYGNWCFGGGGGAGWYGGGGGLGGSGGGGSGYLNTSKLVSGTYSMYCHDGSGTYSGTTTGCDIGVNTTTGTNVSSEPVANSAKTGDGAARITQLSAYLGI